MGRVKYKNKILSKIITFIVVILILLILGLFVYYEFYNQTHQTVFDLGDRSSVDYEDTLLTNYKDYIELKNNYSINSNLNKDDFLENNYLAYFDEYNPCSEKKYKKVDNIKYDTNVEITFRTYNKCGFCHSNIVLYLIKLDKKSVMENITYNYIFDKKIDCGNV